MSQGESVDSMSLDHVQLAADSVNRLIDNRRAPATKARYRTALRSIARWLEPIVPLDQHPTVFTTDDQGKIVPRIPIDEKYLIAFIGRINEQDQYGTYTVSGNEEKKETPVERPKRKSKKTPSQPSSSSSSSNLQTRSVTSAVSSAMTAETDRPIRKGYAVSTMEAIWSALKYEYEKAGMILSDNIQGKFSAALEGYKHKLADMALEGVWGKSSAKEVLDMKQIQGIAEHLFKNDPLFSWPYFLLEWNLACRKRSVAELMMNHLSLSNDCIRIAVVKSKTRQDGENTHSNRIHIYANPSLHFFCPFLALAMIIFTKSASSSLGTSLRLFEGEPASVAERFSQQLKKALDKVLITLITLKY